MPDGYLAFKMRDEPEFNFPWSHEVTAALRAQGHTVFNPAEQDEANGFDPTTPTAEPLAVYLEFDLAEVCRRPAIFLGKNWRESQGACIEGFVAASLDKACYEVQEHRGSNRDAEELHVSLHRIAPALVIASAYAKVINSRIEQVLA